ncbi:PH domain-containing protein [Nocardioides massiliensis]|uniref:Low molecular weight protein antigen 6 PH domain-containing protein n=1 Tax=Nocardioides massiliensis TaxID=1325935 RepID=A0ABT9NR31_9ACTN|nr:PH domain-containing protein [Nocardioides massiliensis]MDP9822880.1 hypothetical protein [Nocardioides massiliensis]
MSSQPVPARSSASGEVDVPALPFRIRPLGVRLAVVAVLVGLFAVCAAVWIGFDDETRAKFTLFQISTLLVLGALFFATGHAVARSRVDVRADGATVVNGYRTYEVAWRDVASIRMRRGAPWASVVLHDGTAIGLLGVLQTEGVRAERAVRQLREVARAANRADRPAA